MSGEIHAIGSEYQGTVSFYVSLGPWGQGIKITVGFWPVGV